MVGDRYFCELFYTNSIVVCLHKSPRCLVFEGQDSNVEEQGVLNTRESVLRRSDKRGGDGVEEVKRGSIPLPKIQRGKKR